SLLQGNSKLKGVSDSGKANYSAGGSSPDTVGAPVPLASPSKCGIRNGESGKNLPSAQALRLLHVERPTQPVARFLETDRRLRRKEARPGAALAADRRNRPGVRPPAAVDPGRQGGLEHARLLARRHATGGGPVHALP